MEKSRLTKKQIVFALKQAELGTSVPEFAANWVSPMPPFTPGVRNTAEFPLLNSNICG